MKENLITKINEKLKEELLTEIRFKVGHISDEQYDFAQQKKNRIEKEDLNEAEKKELEQTANYIDDDNLREKFLNLLTESRKTNKWREKNNWHECPE